MGCTAPPHDGYYHCNEKPKPDIWHMEIAVNIQAKPPEENDDYDAPLRQMPFMYFTGIVEFVFSIRIGHHIDTSRTIKYEERGHSAFQSVERAFGNVIKEYGYWDDNIRDHRSRGPRCPVDFRKLPVFLSIDHLPEHFQEMVKQIITGQHFKFLQQ